MTGSSSSPSPSSTAKEPKPSHLNTLNSSGLFQLVSMDKMSVQYVGTAQADCPAPTKKTAYFFEMTVRNAGDKGQVAIGFTGKDYKLRRQPGWEANSCGYHGDDGLSTVDMEEEKLLAPNIRLVILLVLVLITQRKSSSQRMVRFLGLSKRILKAPCIVPLLYTARMKSWRVHVSNFLVSYWSSLLEFF